ncbi:hypothetical protein ACVBIL_13700 [Shewanella sp. 125m-7]
MTNKTDAAETRFKALCKEYIESQTLSEQALANIECMLTGVGTDTTRESYGEQERATSSACESKNQSQQGKPFVKMILAIAASALLLALGLQLSPYIHWQQSEGSLDSPIAVNSISWKIADEVAKNHIKMKPLEVETGQLPELRGYFTELDFIIVNSSRFAASHQMLGGRYCSILGEAAAQLRFTNKGQAFTLYEVLYDPLRHGDIPRLEAGEQPIEVLVRGVAVSIWLEKGLLMATAHSAD